MTDEEFKKEKKALDFLILNPEGKISNLKKIDEEVIKNLKNRNYLEINNDLYQVTEEGISNYLKFYSKKDFIDGEHLF